MTGETFLGTKQSPVLHFNEALSEAVSASTSATMPSLLQHLSSGITVVVHIIASVAALAEDGACQVISWNNADTVT